MPQWRTRMALKSSDLNVAFKSTRPFLDGTAGEETRIDLEPIRGLLARTRQFVDCCIASLTPAPNGNVEWKLIRNDLDVTGNRAVLILDFTDGKEIKRFTVSVEAE